MNRKERALREYFKKRFENREEMIAFLLDDEGDQSDRDVFSAIAVVLYARLDEGAAYRIERNLYGEASGQWIAEALKQLGLYWDLECSWQERGRGLVPIFERVNRYDTITINGYTARQWLQEFGAHRPNQVVVYPKTLVGEHPAETCLEHRFFHVKEWASGKGEFFYCWHEYYPDTQTLALKPQPEDI
jgi:hypothetical protein